MQSKLLYLVVVAVCGSIAIHVLSGVKTLQLYELISAKVYVSLSSFLGVNVTRVNLTPSPAPRKRIVYVCNKLGCGGLADRQKGIVSAYVLAAMLDREFKIHVTVPCDLSNFLLPSDSADWRIAEERMMGPDVRRIVKINMEGVFFMKQAVKNGDLERQFPDNVTGFTWNMELVQHLLGHNLTERVPWLPGRSVPDIYKFVWDALVTLRPELQKELDAFRDSRSAPADSKLVCAQIRLGNDSGFSDTEKYFSPAQAFPVLANFFSKFEGDEKYRFFVASDSKTLISLAENSSFGDRLLKIPGPITHVDRFKGENACDGFRKAILDQYALAMCDVLVISQSGLGKIAAFRRGTDDNLFLFRGSEIVPFKRDSAFPVFRRWW